MLYAAVIFKQCRVLDDMKQYTSFYRVILYINYFFNAVFCTLCPPILSAFGGKYLVDRYQWNRSVIFLFVVLGLVVGICSGISLFRKTAHIFPKSDTDTQSPFRIEKNAVNHTESTNHKKTEPQSEEYPRENRKHYH